MTLKRLIYKVSWEFFYIVLELKGFGGVWRKWIRRCLTSTNFSILINGGPRGKILASRGLRQGDPLSPFLFTIVRDALSRSIQYCLERNILRGFDVGKDKVEGVVLQYVDDTMAFCPKESAILERWWEILNLFMRGFGLSLNLAKTSNIGINMSNQEVDFVTSIIGINMSNLKLKTCKFSYVRVKSKSI